LDFARSIIALAGLDEAKLHFRYYAEHRQQCNVHITPRRPGGNGFLQARGRRRQSFLKTDSPSN